MAYNKINLYYRIIEVQEMYQQYKVAEATHAGVYRVHIKPKFRISLRTLNNYLATPAVAELKRLAAAGQVATEAKEKFKQLPLFNEEEEEDNAAN